MNILKNSKDSGMKQAIRNYKGYTMISKALKVSGQSNQKDGLLTEVHCRGKLVDLPLLER